MVPDGFKKKSILVIAKILCLTALASAALITGRAGVYLDPTGLLFVLGAGIARGNGCLLVSVFISGVASVTMIQHFRFSASEESA